MKGAYRVKFALKCDKPFCLYCLYTLLCGKKLKKQLLKAIS